MILDIFKIDVVNFLVHPQAQSSALRCALGRLPSDRFRSSNRVRDT